jgi:hypothetical protein
VLPQKPRGCLLVAPALLLLTISALLSGCGSISGNDHLIKPFDGADQAMVRGVPFYPQQEYQCGPAALAMMLTWSGIPATPDALVPQIYTPSRKGSLQSALIAGARRHGRIAYPITGMQMLFDEIDADRPVLVLLNLSFFWYPKWHYAVVIGYDRNEKIIYLHSGTREKEKLSFRVFNNTWARSGFWGLLVLPPSQMPVNPDYRKWLDAAVGLELAEQWQAAEAAYERASEQWPQSANIWIGLGNSHFALRDLPGAALAFEKAIHVRPDSGVAYNNLAKTLAAMGHYEKGLAAARHAVILGGPFLEQFRNTLSEIKAEIPSSPVSP